VTNATLQNALQSLRKERMTILAYISEVERMLGKTPPQLHTTAKNRVLPRT
jgi:hypothetical protein